MRSRFAGLLALLLSGMVLGLPVHARAQSKVVVGNAAVELTGPWKFHTGDNMAWAQPNFDDSAWGTMDLTPPQGSYDPIFGANGFVPGWTGRGHAGHSGYAWYRLRVNIQDNAREAAQGSQVEQTAQNSQKKETAQSAGGALALKMPDNVDDAYQVYMNGQFIGQFGNFRAHGVTAYSTQPRAFRLPAGIGSGETTIAVRMWMSSDTPLYMPDAGGMHGPPILGQASVMKAMLRLGWDAIDRIQAFGWLEFAIVFLALLVAFGLYWLDRSEPAYFWLGLTCTALLASRAVILVFNYTTWMGITVHVLLGDAVLIPLVTGLWVLFWGYWFRLDHMVRLHRMVWGLVVLLGAGSAMLRTPFYGRVIPAHAIAWFTLIPLTMKLLLGVLLIWVTYRGIRKNRAEGWLALPAVVLVAISRYQNELLVLGVPTSYFPFGYGIGLSEIATILSLMIIAVLMLRRFLQAQREREQFKLEMEQARHIQQMLIPEAVPAVPGFTLEGEYRPAQQVGGDFFQIVEGDDGSILVVLGDVSGKGLEAAMLVSLIVGTIRTLAVFTRDPMEILSGMNERLCGRMRGHFATCVVVGIAPAGETTVANAGHIAPYLNGEEVAIAGSLPLGMIEGAEFEQTQFTLQPGDRLTLMTDGVVEAQGLDRKSGRRELFGFARTSELMRQGKPAAEVADIAQQFGQEDDITVLRVVRDAGLVLA